MSNSIVKLTLDGCSLDEEATRLFRDIFYSTENKIRELHVHGLTVSGGLSAYEVMAEILAPPGDQKSNDSEAEKISLLEVLDLGRMQGNIGSAATIYEALGANPKGIRLQRFRDSSWFDAASSVALSACLPKLLYLKELSIFANGVANDRKQQFLLGLATNGSLHHVSIRDPFNHYTVAEKSRIQRYCKGNRCFRSWSPSRVATVAVAKRTGVFSGLFLQRQSRHQEPPLRLADCSHGPGGLCGSSPDRFKWNHWSFGIDDGTNRSAK